MLPGGERSVLTEGVLPAWPWLFLLGPACEHTPADCMDVYVVQTPDPTKRGEVPLTAACHSPGRSGLGGQQKGWDNGGANAQRRDYF